jgi:ubiquinone/menaquinone biosynthesis C-methylase UbiE
VTNLNELNTLTKKMYHNRFPQKEFDFRTKMWKTLCENFFQKYVPEDSTVLDIASGNCEFINAIKARTKIALDINPSVKNFVEDNVKVILSPSTKMNGIESNSIDVAFTSNFFEHLNREEIIQTIREIYRILKPSESLLILQPNYRFCYKDYFMFFDHITALDDRSLCEILEVSGFKVIECKPKFLPYSTKSRLPQSIYLLKLYLHLEICQKIFGK